MKKLPANIHFAVLATDVALFTLKDGELLVRLMTVNRPPYYKNQPGLPGGLLNPKEDAEQAVARHLEDRAGIRPRAVYMEQLYTFSRIDRDPRGRVVSVGYFAIVPWESLTMGERENTSSVYWAPVSKATKLAYDHDEILKKAVRRVRGRSMHSTLIAKFLPEEFTLTQLEQAYQGVLQRSIDKRNFRKKIIRLKMIKKVNRKVTGLRHRPAQLYKFVSTAVELIGVFSN
jgi:8-oxo-dGTP diphosphatase